MKENKKISQLINRLNAVVPDPSYLSKLSFPSLANAEKIFCLTQHLMFKKYYSQDGEAMTENEAAERLYILLGKCIDKYIPETESDKTVIEIIDRLPEIKSTLIADAVAIYEGDPAARSLDEIILCYPGFFAATAYRISHLIYEKNIPYLPRMISEYAHRMTGIDIHPGARIGQSLCIDHGTGTVIGETAEIGDRVKIYQGVTVGAKSFSSDSSGRLVRDKKRHPTIESDCIIYAGATILGGDTVIGEGSIIGGNVWLTHSVPPNSKIYYKEK